MLGDAIKTLELDQCRLRISSCLLALQSPYTRTPNCNSFS